MEENLEELEKDMTPILLEDLGLMEYNRNKHKVRHGKYQCSYCNNIFIYATKYIHSTLSCGCVPSDYNISHGLRSHRLYNTWRHMLCRCYDPKEKQYCDYGGRGIKACDEWKDIRNFVKWVEEKSNWEEGLTLDRINTNGNYCPENCTFSDRTLQSINQRMQSNNTSGFVGVSWRESIQRWRARVQMYGKEKYIGQYKTLEEAVEARDKYIIDNNLPHPLSTYNKLSKL